VAQDRDLKVPLAAAAREHADDTAQEPVQQHAGTTRSLNRSRTNHQHSPPGGIEFLYPTGQVLGTPTPGAEDAAIPILTTQREGNSPSLLSYLETGRGESVTGSAVPRRQRDGRATGE